jgi:prepilin-type N-terminal cleavage/methylation domain-containing protein
LVCRPGAARYGFSLVEILVVLVVLLIGILSLVRLFPFGFLSLQRTEELTNAGALAQQQLDTLRDLPARPKAISGGLPDVNGDIQEIDTDRPDDNTELYNADLTTLGLPFSLPKNYSGYYYSDINRIRYIHGETFRIPVATANASSSAYGSIYSLQYGPVYNVFHTDANNNQIDSLHVLGAPLSRSVQSALVDPINNNPGVPNLANETQYAIDYLNHRIAFFPKLQPAGLMATSRLFTFKFAVYTQANANAPVVLTDYTFTIQVPYLPTTTDPVQPIWQDIFDNNLSQVVGGNGQTPQQILATIVNGIIPGTDTANRQFRLVTSTPVVDPIGKVAAPQWSTDPYEYAWYHANDAVYPDANPGVLIFNPLGHVSYLDASHSNDTAAGFYTGNQSLVASVDYLTYDNHIIRDDRSMPGLSNTGVAGTGVYRIKLSLNNILSTGDILKTQNTYAGIFSDPTQATTTVNTSVYPDILILNMSTGDIVCEIQNGVATPPVNTGYNGNPLLSATLDAHNGILTFPATLKNGPNLKLEGVEDLGLQNAPLRVLYRANNEWGMQVQEAAQTYTQVPDVSLLTTTTFFAPAADPITQQPTNTKVYFPVSEAGKTVTLGEVYYDDGTAVATDPSSYKRAANLTFQINDNPANFISVPSASGNTKVVCTYLDLTDQIPTAKQFSPSATLRTVDYVLGVSLKSRVIWRDGVRWRQVDNDTVVKATGN